MTMKNRGEAVNYKGLTKLNQQDLAPEGRGEEGVQEDSEVVWRQVINWWNQEFSRGGKPQVWQG